jgi:hypothetical protein
MEGEGTQKNSEIRKNLFGRPGDLGRASMNFTEYIDTHLRLLPVSNSLYDELYDLTHIISLEETLLEYIKATRE